MIITADGNIPSKFAHSFNVMKMAQGFCDAGHDVTLVSLMSLPNLIEKFKIKDIYSYYGVSDKIKIKLLPVLNRDFLSKSIGANGFNLKAAQFIKKNNPNFVYCRSYLTLYYCVQSGSPSVIETHTTLYDHPDLQKVYQIAHLPDFLGLVTIHDTIKKEHVKRGVPEDKILVLEDGVDLSQFNIEDDRQYWRHKLGFPAENKIVMYCGSLYKEKGIEDILMTAKALAQNKDTLFIIVGGRDEEITKWKQFNIKHRIDNVKFTGFANNSLVPMHLKSADVLIMPYSTNMNYGVMDLNSTSPLKLFEYMAAKRPVVSSTVPTITKVVKHNESALLAKPGDISSLANYVSELLKSPEKGIALSRNAFNIVTEYSWKKRCETIINRLIKTNIS